MRFSLMDLSIMASAKSRPEGCPKGCGFGGGGRGNDDGCGGGGGGGGRDGDSGGGGGGGGGGDGDGGSGGGGGGGMRFHLRSATASFRETQAGGNPRDLRFAALLYALFSSGVISAIRFCPAALGAFSGLKDRHCH